jgi:hypothetical protein
MAPSPATEQLAEIAYQVAYNKHKSHVSAEKKKSKWLNIPAFLVTLVHANQNEVIQDAACSPYDALPFVPPETERQLEDVSPSALRGPAYRCYGSLKYNYIQCSLTFSCCLRPILIVCGCLCRSSELSIESTLRRYWKQMGDRSSHSHASVSEASRSGTHRSSGSFGHGGWYPECFFQ